MAVRQWLCVEVWISWFLLWPRLVLPAFLVGAQGMRIVVGWGRCDTVRKRSQCGECCVACLYELISLKINPKTTKNHSVCTVQIKKVNIVWKGLLFLPSHLSTFCGLRFTCCCIDTMPFFKLIYVYISGIYRIKPGFCSKCHRAWKQKNNIPSESRDTYNKRPKIQEQVSYIWWLSMTDRRNLYEFCRYVPCTFALAGDLTWRDPWKHFILTKISLTHVLSFGRRIQRN